MGALALLQLADGRLPAGGHAHSAGLEQAVVDGRVTDLATLDRFVRGRLHSSVRTEAALAVAVRRATLATEPAAVPWAALAAEAEARTAAPAQRQAARKLGRQLLRVARPTWPHRALDVLAAALPTGAPYPVALGAVAAAAGLGDRDTAWVVAFGAVTTPTSAAVRLLGLDPVAVHRLVARLEPELEVVVAAAVADAEGPLDQLPGRSSVLVDLTADRHLTQRLRLFAS